jgi:hypothetical protein
MLSIIFGFKIYLLKYLKIDEFEMTYYFYSVGANLIFATDINLIKKIADRERFYQDCLRPRFLGRLTKRTHQPSAKGTY